jgi:hypothetical protein
VKVVFPGGAPKLLKFGPMASTPSSSLLCPLKVPGDRAVSLPSASIASLVASRPVFWVTMLALLATFIKITLALNTFGTNDVAAFYTFSRSLADHGLEWTYRNGVVWFSGLPIFNHPPLTAYYLQFIRSLSQQEIFQSWGITFPFLLRLPGIVADFVVVLVLLRLSQTDVRFRVPTWALALFAISPVSLMVSGFHGNTDPVVVMFLVLAAYMCLRERPVLCGIFLALSCQIKVIPLLLLPIVFFFWLGRGAARRFTVSFVLLCLIMWAEPLIKFPMLFLKCVLGYSSYWGSWGITYWLRLTRWPQFNGSTAFNLPWAAAVTVFLLKLGIITAVLVIAWRRRYLPGRALFDSIAYAWIIFFVFSPGISLQYLVWLAPFVLVLSPTLYAWLVVSSSVYLFFFYNTTAGGLPWYVAISTNKLDGLNLWAPWSLLPWGVLLFGMIFLWKEAVAADPSLRLCSLQTLRKQQHY